MSPSLKHQPRYYYTIKLHIPHSYSRQPLPKTPMASVCASDAVDDALLHLRRPTYVNLHRWPESEAEFVKTVSSNKGRVTSSPTRVVDSISGRQMYLRSYTFSRKEEGVKDKTFKCLSGLKQRMVSAKNVSNLKSRITVEFFMLRRAKNASSAAFLSVYHRLLSCSSKAHHHGQEF